MSDKKCIAYANGSTQIISEEQARILTHVNLSFGNLTDDLKIDVSKLTILRDGFLEQLKKWNPELKVLVSLVGSQWSAASATEEGRAAIAESCADLMKSYPLDGVDFDWEYPCVPSNGVPASPADRHNFTLLLRDVRRRLDREDRHFLLTIAAGADVYYCENVEIPAIVPYLDYINVMTYDLKCGFHALSGHHSNLYCTPGDYFHNSCDRAMRIFEQYGAPKEKLILGAAFYSRKWENVPDANHGLLQLTKNGGGYGPGYDELSENYVNKQGFVRYWDDYAKAPWLFDGSTLFSYDDEESIAAKCAYVLDRGYGGIFYWNHANDRTGNLLRAIGRGLKG